MQLSSKRVYPDRDLHTKQESRKVKQSWAASWPMVINSDVLIAGSQFISSTCMFKNITQYCKDTLLLNDFPVIEVYILFCIKVLLMTYSRQCEK